MRKSIKRIVSTVLAATMVLTSTTVANLSTTFAADGSVSSLPITIDSSTGSNTPVKFDDVVKGTEVKVSAVINYSNVGNGKPGAFVTVQANKGTGTSETTDTIAKVKLGSGGVLTADVNGDSLGTANENTDVPVDFIINTETGAFSIIVNGTTYTSSAFVDSKFTNGIAGVKISAAKKDASNYRITTLKSLTYSNGTPVGGETTTVTTTTTTTEATTVEPTTEATTSAVDTTTETTTLATAEANQVVITPIYTKTADGGVDVDYYASVGEGAKFNNYTLFVDFDAAKLAPKTANDGNITLVAGKDATGNDIVLKASNATNIANQFANVPAAGNSDFTGADGTKTQAQLGRIKVAYCVFDNDFSVAAGNLPAFATSGKLFSIHFDAVEGATVDGANLSVSVGTLNAVSADATVNSTPANKTNDTVIGGAETTTEATTETTTVTTTETTTVDTAFAIAGDTVNAKTGDVKTVTFKLNNNPGVASVVAIVSFDPTKLELQSGAVNGFAATSDVINNQMAYVPTAGDPDYAGKADGTKTAAQLGIVKFALANAGSDVTGNGTAFTLNFKVLATEAGTYNVDLNVLSAANTSATLIDCVGKNGAIVIAGSEVTTEATTIATTEATTETTTVETTTKKDTTTETTTVATTETTTRKQGGSSGGGGGGGSSTKHNTTTTTEATTVEASTETTTAAVDTPSNDEKPPVVIDPDKGISVNPPVQKNEDFKGFQDIENYPWAKDSINKLAELGIISGVADGTYGPALPCKRGDFAILINKTLGIQVTSTEKNFTDNADSSKYYYNDLIVGYNAGILSGYGDNNYKPEQYCTREEMAVLIAKSFEWLGNDVTSVDQSVNNKYSDVANISWWSAPYVAYLTDKGIMNGNADGTLLPKNYINRAEMAVMMSKVYDYAVELVNAKRAELNLNQVEG